MDCWEVGGRLQSDVVLTLPYLLLLRTYSAEISGSKGSRDFYFFFFFFFFFLKKKRRRGDMGVGGGCL